MKKLTFSEINQFVSKHTNSESFSKDLELFKKHFPVHKLNADLARANQYSFEKLDGQMLVALLGVVPPEEILKNRESSITEVVHQPKTSEEIKELLSTSLNLSKAFLDRMDDGQYQLLANYSESDLLDLIREILKNREQIVVSILKNSFGYTEETIQAFPEEYVRQLIEAADSEAVVAIEKNRVENSKPTSLEGLKAFLSVEFGLTEEKLVNIPQETLDFFMQRTNSEIRIGYERLQDLPKPTSEKEEKQIVVEVVRDNVKAFQKRITDAKTSSEVEAILQEDNAGGARKGVQNFGAARLIELEATSTQSAQDKKKEQN